MAIKPRKKEMRKEIKKGTRIDHMTERERAPKPGEALQRFFAKLNGFRR